MALRRFTTLSTHILAPNRYITPVTTFKLGSAFSTTPIDMSKVKQLVDTTIADNDVVVFSKSYCPYCKRSKSTLAELTSDAKVLELDEIEDGPAIQAYLRELNGQSTVPHVYIRQQFIGGNSDLQAISHGELKKKIAGAA